MKRPLRCWLGWHKWYRFVCRDGANALYLYCCERCGRVERPLPVGRYELVGYRDHGEA